MTRFRTRLWYSPGRGYCATIAIYAQRYHVKYDIVCDTANERDTRVRDIMNEHKQKEQAHG
jgi:glutaredoxin-related protein